MPRPNTTAVRLLAGEREPVLVATTANITLSGLQTIDGVLLVAGNRVLVKNQTDATTNGIYDASAGTWYRAGDARSSRTINKGVTVHVQSGTVNAGRVYAFQTLDPDIGEDNILITLFLSDDFAADAQALTAAFLLAIQNAGTSILGSVANPVFASKAAAEAFDPSPDPVPGYIILVGYSAAGDTGVATVYKPVVSEPSHLGKVQTADGQWWEMSPPSAGAPVSAFGVLGTANDAATFQAAINYGIAKACPIIMPGGTFYFTSGLTIAGELKLCGVGRGTFATQLAPAAGVNLIVISTDHPCHLHDFKIVYPGSATGVAIQVTSPDTMNTKTTIERLWIEVAYIAIHMQRCYGFTINDCYLNASVARNILIENSFNSDHGDSLIFANSMVGQAGTTHIEHRSGGGLRVSLNKLIGGLHGYWGHMTAGFFSSIKIDSNSIELGDTNAYDVLFTKEAGLGTGPIPNQTVSNITVTGNQMSGAVGVGVAADPDVPATRKWLWSLNVTGNVWAGFNLAGAATFFQVDGCYNFSCVNNTIRELSSPYQRVSIGAACENGIVGLNLAPSTVSASSISGSATDIDSSLPHA